MRLKLIKIHKYIKNSLDANIILLSFKPSRQ